jgi:dihydroorotate dehydrogenase
MSLYRSLGPLLFRIPAETAHGAVHGLLRGVQRAGLDRVLARQYAIRDSRLRVDALGETFPNPVGVAAGFDKNARLQRALAGLGFGFVEVGGVTATPQSGNPRPRLFRLREDEALINRMGLNNEGAAAVGARLARTDAPVPVGINVAKSEDVPLDDAAADYRETYEAVGDHADFVVVNVSCPNSGGFRELGNREPMERILRTLLDAGADPLLVKLSPDIPDPAMADAVDIVNDLGLDGVVATNTTTDRPASLRSKNRAEEGGLSGAPIESRATEAVRFVAERTDAPVIGVGGVATAEDAYRKIRAGASLVQLYTGLVYRGPGVAREINRGLLELLDRDGFDGVNEAVGADL